MTVAELIAKLQTFPPDVTVYAMSGRDGEPCTPEPEYRDWGKPDDPDRGVYL